MTRLGIPIIYGIDAIHGNDNHLLDCPMYICTLAVVLRTPAVFSNSRRSWYNRGRRRPVSIPSPKTASIFAGRRSSYSRGRRPSPSHPAGLKGRRSFFRSSCLLVQDLSKTGCCS